MSTATAPLPPDTEVEMTFAWIPPGRFVMGGDKENDEKPAHRVTITKGFWMGVYPVTQEQFEAVMGYNPSHFRGPTHPVENVNWFDAQEFCTAFGKLTSRPVRLPTEAEWEYACRATTTSDYWSGNDEVALKRVAWYGSTNGPSRGQTQPVGKLEKNKWGLYDVHGNVWEWCEDVYEAYKGEDQTDPSNNKQSNDCSLVLRGGSWLDGPVGCRAAYRNRSAPASRGNRYGFRVCFRLD
jgi:formylglycine-generating enzyme required for sulfatase activity